MNQAPYTIITGSTSGIGEATAKALAAHKVPLILPVRNIDKGEALKAELKNHSEIHVISCDLGSLKSVANCAQVIQDLNFPINRIINNAGGIWMEKNLTADGYERSFQVNHLAHFLLTSELIPLLKQSEDSRVINLSSAAHFLSRSQLDDPMFQTRPYKGMTAYADSKFYNILFTRDLFERYGDWLFTAAVHPGVVGSGFSLNNKGWVSRAFRWMRPFILKPEKGCLTTLYCASVADRKLNGLYWNKQKPSKTLPAAMDSKLSEKLRIMSENLIRSALAES